MSYRNGPTTVTNGLVMYLDAANSKSIVSGSNSWRDLSKNINNATLTNGPTYSSEVGGCIIFDGSNDYGIVSNSTTLNMGGKSFTADIWISVSTTSGTERMILEYNVWSTQGTYQVTTQPNQIVVNFIDANGAGKALYHSIPTFTNGIWTNVVGQFDTVNNTISLYINGSRVAQNTAVTQEIGNAVSSLHICSRGGGSLFLPCKIASIKMYNIALSASEVLQNYNATKKRFGL
jgi:hypothetical protein